MNRDIPHLSLLRPSIGFNFGINYSPGWLFFKALSGVFGSIDYVICRSFYPAWPMGWSPWRKTGESWWSLYFPNTRALWGDYPPDTHEEAQALKPPAAAIIIEQPKGQPQTGR